MFGRLVSCMLLSIIASCSSRPFQETEQTSLEISSDDEPENQVPQFNEDLESISEELDQLQILSQDLLEVYNLLKDVQESISQLEDSLTFLQTPMTYYEVLEQMNEEKDLRDSLSEDLNAQIIIAEERLLELSIYISEVKSVIDTADSTLQEQRESLSALELEYLSVNRAIRELCDFSKQLFSSIQEFTQDLDQRLNTPAIVGQFQFSEDNPAHFNEVCLEGGVSRLDGRSTTDIAQVQFTCTNDDVSNPIGIAGANPAAEPLSCGDGYIAKGIQGSAGDTLGSIGLICTLDSRVDSPIVLRTDLMGDPQSGDPFEYYCPARTVLIGITGYLREPNNDALMEVFPVCKKIPLN